MLAASLVTFQGSYETVHPYMPSGRANMFFLRFRRNNPEGFQLVQTITAGLAELRIREVKHSEQPYYFIFPALKQQSTLVSLSQTLLSLSKEDNRSFRKRKVLVVVSLALFLPICLEQSTRDNEYPRPDHVKPCMSEGQNNGDAVR